MRIRLKKRRPQGETDEPFLPWGPRFLEDHMPQSTKPKRWQLALAAAVGAAIGQLLDSATLGVSITEVILSVLA